MMGYRFQVAAHGVPNSAGRASRQSTRDAGMTEAWQNINTVVLTRESNTGLHE